MHGRTTPRLGAVCAATLLFASVLVAAVAMSAAPADAAVLRFKIGGTVTRGGFSFDLEPGDTVFATGVFDDRGVAETGTSFLRFGDGTGNEFSLRLGDVVLQASNATGYSNGALPVMRFNDGVPDSISFDAEDGVAGSSVNFTSSLEAFSADDMTGTWDFSTFNTGYAELLVQVIGVNGVPNSVVVDTTTGLMWLRNAGAGGRQTWEEALQWAEQLDYAGFDDWRLPATLIPDPYCGGSRPDGKPAGFGCVSEMGWLVSHHGVDADVPGPFLNVATDGSGYWSGDLWVQTDSPFSTEAFFHSFNRIFPNQDTVTLAGTTPLGEPTRYQNASAWAVRGPRFVDGDGDGVPTYADNCPSDGNFGQSNADGDLLGDACDPDIDDDGVPNTEDAFPHNRNEWADADRDGLGDNADPDDDDDGQTDSDEIACGSDPLDAGSLSSDFDGDGRPDCVDLDDDDDGVPDTDDAYPTSDLEPTIYVQGTDTGVVNEVTTDGASLNDLLATAAADTESNGTYQATVAELTGRWQADGLISERDRGRIMKAASKPQKG